MDYKTTLAVVLLTTMACSQADEDNNNTHQKNKVNNGAAEVLKSSESKPGEQALLSGELSVETLSSGALKVTLRYTNTQSHPVPIVFYSGMTADLWLFNSGGETVWNWSKDMMFTQAIRETSLLAGETKEIEFQIDAKLAKTIKKGFYLEALFSGRSVELEGVVMSPAIYHF